MPGTDDGLRQTLISYVPPWEIDANGHWNTQFYMRAFQSAAEQALPAGTPPRSATDVPAVDHVRFFRELRILEPVSIFSASLQSPADGYSVAHLMRQGVTGALCACAFGTMSAPDLRPLPRDPAPIGPRGLAPGAHGPADVEALLDAEQASVTHLGVLHPSDLDHRGNLLAYAIHNRVSEGTGHLWEFLGVRQSDFYDRGLGRAIVEMKVTRHPGAATGQVVRLISWMEELGERSFHLRHRLECLTSGRTMADVSSLTLILNMTSRRSAPVPCEIRRKLGKAARDGRSPALGLPETAGTDDASDRARPLPSPRDG